MFRKIAAVTAVSAALIAPTAWSLGLGEIKTESALNQPLRATIKLLSSKEFDEKELRARIASFETYSKFGVSRERFHSLLKFNVETAADGSKYIEVTSDDIIREPFVNVLIELNWDQGKLLREYTMLLDPPVYNRTQQSIAPATTRKTVAKPVVEKQVVEPKATKTKVVEPPKQEPETPVKSTQTVVQEKEPVKPVVKPTRTAVPQFEGNTWSVGRGQTLWSIAKQVRPDGVSIQQTLAALYRNNPSAFINNDINRLKAGAKLQIPGSNNMEQISQQSALNDLYRSSSAASAPLDVRKTADETTAQVNETSQGGRLTLGSVEQDSSSDSSGTSLDGSSDDAANSAKIDELNETIETLRLQNERLKEQLTETDSASDTGLAVADDTLSVLSGGAEVDPSTLEGENTLASGTDEIAVDTAETSVEENVADLAADKAIEEATEKAAEVEAETSNKPVNSMLQNEQNKDNSLWYYIGGGILALLALIGGLFVMRRNRSNTSDSSLLPDMESMATASKARDNYLENESKKRSVDVEVDPVETADVAIAKGNLALAETTLLTALTQDETNDMLRIKLMELYAGKQDTGAFKEQLSALSSDFDMDSELGVKVKSLMASVDTDDDSMDVFGEELDLSEEDVFDNLDDALEDTEELVAEETAVDLDLTDFENSNVIDFETSSLDGLVEESSTEELSIEEPLASEEVAQEAADSSEGLSLVDDNFVENDEPNPEAETKLELAKAYIEMGEEESAKDFLKEAIAEGNAAQIQEAEEMLSKL